MDSTDPLDRSVHVPGRVVARELAGETVLLDVESGQYHGLNDTAGVMFAALRSAATPREAVAGLAKQLPAAGHQLEQDLSELCLALAERGLIELGDPEA